MYPDPRRHRPHFELPGSAGAGPRQYPNYTQISYNSVSQEQTTQLKMGRIPEKISFQRRHKDRQEAHVKMFNNHLGNANQNHNKLLQHTCQNGYYQKTTNNN